MSFEVTLKIVSKKEKNQADIRIKIKSVDIGYQLSTFTEKLRPIGESQTFSLCEQFQMYVGNDRYLAFLLSICELARVKCSLLLFTHHGLT